MMEELESVGWKDNSLFRVGDTADDLSWFRFRKGLH
jgi:hypothetical protein